MAMMTTSANAWIEEIVTNHADGSTRNDTYVECRSSSGGFPTPNKRPWRERKSGFIEIGFRPAGDVYGSYSTYSRLPFNERQSMTGFAACDLDGDREYASFHFRENLPQPELAHGVKVHPPI